MMTRLRLLQVPRSVGIRSLSAASHWIVQCCKIWAHLSTLVLERFSLFSNLQYAYTYNIERCIECKKNWGFGSNDYQSRLRRRLWWENIELGVFSYRNGELNIFETWCISRDFWTPRVGSRNLLFEVFGWSWGSSLQNGRSFWWCNGREADKGLPTNG